MVELTYLINVITNYIMNWVCHDPDLLLERLSSKLDLCNPGRNGAISVSSQSRNMSWRSLSGALFSVSSFQTS